MRTKRYLQNHVVYQITKMVLRNTLASPVRGAHQNGHAPSRAFGWAQKSIHAGSIVISLDAGYRGDAEDFQPERQLIRRLLYSPAELPTFSLGVVHNRFAFYKNPPVLILGSVPIFSKPYCRLADFFFLGGAFHQERSGSGAGQLNMCAETINHFLRGQSNSCRWNASVYVTCLVSFTILPYLISCVVYKTIFTCGIQCVTALR